MGIDMRDVRDAREKLKDAVWGAVNVGMTSCEIDNLVGAAADEAQKDLAAAPKQEGP